MKYSKLVVLRLSKEEFRFNCQDCGHGNNVVGNKGKGVCTQCGHSYKYKFK